VSDADHAPSPSGPAVDETDRRLAPSVVTLWRAGAVLPVLMLFVPALLVAGGLGGAAWLAPVAVLAFALATIVVLPPLRYRRWRWRLTPVALELEHGVLIRQIRVLPYFRIQHIDVEHGPLDRALGLARLEVHTASVIATLPGLPADDAQEVRMALLMRARSSVLAAPADDDAV
jgi:uncharacterized protein